MPNGSGFLSGLDEIDLRAAAFAVAHLCRTAPSVPPTVWRLRDKLDAAIRCQVSPPGQQNGSDPAELATVEIVGTNLAAALLGWHPRRVRRHVTDLGGRLVGGRLVFDAAQVREYAAALQHEGGTDNG